MRNFAFLFPAELAHARTLAFEAASIKTSALDTPLSYHTDPGLETARFDITAHPASNIHEASSPGIAQNAHPDADCGPH
jgi:hypothetical protein